MHGSSGDWRVSLLWYQYTTDIAKDSSTKLHSVTQERDLDEFLNTAQLAATDFTAGENHSFEQKGYVY